MIQLELPGLDRLLKPYRSLLVAESDETRCRFRALMEGDTLLAYVYLGPKGTRVGSVCIREGKQDLPVIKEWVGGETFPIRLRNNKDMDIRAKTFRVWSNLYGVEEEAWSSLNFPV